MLKIDLKELHKKPITDLSFAVVDTETTGMNAQFNRVMDIGIIIVENGQITEKWETLIDPQQRIDYWITHYTNLTDKHVRGKPKFEQLAEKIVEMLKDRIFVAHSVGFDYGFLHWELKRAGYDFNLPNLCTVKLGRKLLPHLAGAHLDALADHYNIKITQRHRALPDAEATAIILLDFLKIAQEKYGAKTFFDLERLQRLKVDKNLANTRNYPLTIV